MKYLLLLLFFISGGCGLGYEILWTRYLELIFGSTTFSVAAILGAFMLGFALGSYYVSKKVVGSGWKAFFYYLLCELVIGIFALFSPFILPSLYYPLKFLYKIFGNNFLIFSFIKFVLATIVLIIPTFMMGATFPLMIESMSIFTKKISKWSSLVYASNLTGASCFIALSLLIFLPKLTLDGTIWLFSFFNIMIFITGYLLYRIKLRVTNYELQVYNATENFTLILVKEKVILLLYLISGFCSFSFEIIWTRYYILLTGGAIYSFGMILFAWIIGLGLGSFIISIFVEKIKDHYFWFSVLQLCIAICAILTYIWITLTPYFYMMVYPSLENTFFRDKLQFLWNLFSKYFEYSFEYKTIVRMILIFIGTIVPTICLGAILPILLRGAIMNGNSPLKSAATLYIFNCIGAVLGSCITSFFLIPLFGLKYTNNILSFMSMLLFFISLEFLSLKKEMTKLIFLLIAIILTSGAIYFQSETKLDGLLSGVYIYGTYYKNLDNFVESLEHKNRLFLYEGQHSVTDVRAVKQVPYNLALSVNGKVDASSYFDLETQILAAHLGFFYRRNIKNALVIGLGSGITAGSISLYDSVKNVQVVEIEKGVVEAARKFFSPDNNSVLYNPKVNLILDDGRSYVFFTSQKYDLVVSEPSNPWISGSSNLFTREFFLKVKEKLQDDGIFVQWFHTYYMKPELVKSLIKTFASVFPEFVMHSVFREESSSFSNDIFLVGSKKSLILDYHHLEKLFSIKKIFKDLLKIGFYDPAQIFTTLYLDKNDAGNLANIQNIKLNTDKNMYIEFSASKFLEMQYLGAITHGEIEKIKTIYFPRIKNYSLKKLLKFDFIRNVVAHVDTSNFPRTIKSFLDCYTSSAKSTAVFKTYSDIYPQNIICGIALYYMYLRNSNFDIAKKFLITNLKSKLSKEYFLDLLFYYNKLQGNTKIMLNILLKLNKMSVSESFLFERMAIYFRDISDMKYFFKFIKKAIKKDKYNLRLYEILLKEYENTNKTKDYFEYQKLKLKRMLPYKLAHKIIYYQLNWYRTIAR